MHVEPSEKLPRSVREFLSHYAMIVLSILTALALEEAALGLEHRREGARAKEEIEQEIAWNHKVVRDALVETRVIEKAWEGLLKRGVEEAKTGQSTDERQVAVLTDAGHQFRDALPPLKTTAWDAAISDHSINYLAHEDLTRYSELYAGQRLFAQAMWDVLRDSAVRDLSSLSLAVELGKPDPKATVATLNSRLRTISIAESQLSQLEAVLSGTMAEPKPVPTSPGAGSTPPAASSR